MASKINVVDVDVVQVELPVEQTEKEAPPVESVEKVVMKRPKTSRSKKEVKQVEQPEQVELPTPVVPVEKVAMKKPRTSRAKKEVQPIPEEPATEEPPKEEPVEVKKEEPEKKNIKTVELVECPKCNKKLTQRTLNYSHKAVCPANGDRTPKVSSNKKHETEYENHLDEGFDKKLQRVNRMKARSEKKKISTFNF